MNKLLQRTDFFQDASLVVLSYVHTGTQQDILCGLKKKRVSVWTQGRNDKTLYHISKNLLPCGRGLNDSLLSGPPQILGSSFVIMNMGWAYGVEIKSFKRVIHLYLIVKE